MTTFKLTFDNIPENWVNYIDNTPKGIEITFVNDKPNTTEYLSQRFRGNFASNACFS